MNEESDPTVIRRNLSEELQPSSKEIAEKIISALVAPNIRKISSEEDLLALRQSAQIGKSLSASTDHCPASPHLLLSQ